jgi:hypothetical protein
VLATNDPTLNILPLENRLIGSTFVAYACTLSSFARSGITCDFDAHRVSAVVKHELQPYLAIKITEILVT